MQKIIFLFVLTITFFKISLASDTDTNRTLNFKLTGFVRSDFWYDTRKVSHVREEIINLYPLDINLDKNGFDLNSVGTFNFSAIASRIATSFDGINAFNAKVKGYIEGDFTGMSNVTINTLRLRHAYIEMNWKKSDLLFGQFWHPMFTTEAFPMVTSLNTGVPFQPFIRNPQIKYTLRLKSFKIIMAALSQRDNASDGPQGRSYSYLANSKIPNLHFQSIFSHNVHQIGAAIDYKSIMPRLVTDSNIATNQRVNGLSYMLFYKFKKHKVEFKSKFIFAENLTEHLLLGGYAVSYIDISTDDRTYTPTQHLLFWSDITYSMDFKKIKMESSIFGGYAKNIGTKQDNIGIYYGTPAQIGKMYRIAPRINLISGNTMISAEWEFTNAFYGDILQNGTVINSHPIANNRFLFVITYFFNKSF
jgi:hypothetical protein